MTSYKSLKTLVLIGLLTALSFSLAAWSITDTYFGNRVNTLDARSFAMGGTGTYNALRPFGITTNPANLTMMKAMLAAQGTLNLNRAQEDRAVPLYNSFDAYLDDAVIASNTNTYDDYAGVALGLYPFGNMRAGLGAYYKPLISFDGNYKEQVRNNRGTDNDSYPELLALNTVDNQGLLNQAGGVGSFGIKLSPALDLNLGLDFSMLSADISQMKSIRWSSWATQTVGAGVLPDSTYINDFTLDGTQLKAGLALQVGPRLGFGATYTLKSTLDRSGTSRAQKDAWLNHPLTDELVTYDDDYILPSELRIGFSYQPRNVVRTWFNLDVERVQWTDISDLYEDTYNLYAGVEHHIENRIPFRFGFQAVNSWRLETASQTVNGVVVPLTWAKKTLTPMITAGSSVNLMEGLTLDLGFGYAWREYESLDNFRDAYYNDKLYTGSSTYALWPNSYIVLKDRGWDNPDKISENYITVMTGLSFAW